MAGIGFELRKMLSRDSYAGVLGAYGYAGLVSSGPWVFSIAGVLAIGVLAGRAVPSAARVTQFLISVTYLMAGSVLLTGPLQLMFSRFVADRIYEERRDRILPNLLGALALTTTGSGALASIVVFRAFPGPFTCQALLVANFVVLCDAWLLTVLLSGIKAHRTVVGLYLAAYVASVGSAFALRHYSLEGLLAGFLVGQAGAMFAALGLSIHAFPGERQARFEFLDPAQSHYDLAAAGAVFYAGTWADKALFWMNPSTSARVLGPLRSSVIYDLPIFLAYLTVIPAMAILFMWLEADFGDRCQSFYAAVRNGAPLNRIERLKDGMVSSVRQGLLAIVKIQAVTLALVFVTGPTVLRAASISPLYLRLLYVDAVGVALQVQFLAALNVLFYLDERKAALALTALFACANVALTLVSQRLGPDWYGFGFAGAALIAAASAVPLLSHKLARLECATFMLQPLWPDENRGRL
ncbi:MAG TPA: exopolysaccharide Pel transporter PelG, partial [Anaeromyxobacteraceae bacterium]